MRNMRGLVASPVRETKSSVTPMRRSSRSSGSRLHPARAASSAPRLTDRLHAWDSTSDLSATTHRAGLGVSQRNLDQGLLNFPRKRQIESPAKRTELHSDTGLIDIKHRNEDKLQFGEVDPPIGKARTGPYISNLDSHQTWEVIDGPQSQPLSPDQTARQDRIQRLQTILSGKKRHEPTTLDAPPLPEAAAAAAIDSRSKNWTHAFKKFPRENDGSVTIDNFVHTLGDLASSASNVKLSGAELDRIVRLVDPDATGVVTFNRFATAFAAASDSTAQRASLAVDGSGLDRTHSTAAFIHSPAGKMGTGGGMLETKDAESVAGTPRHLFSRSNKSRSNSMPAHDTWQHDGSSDAGYADASAGETWASLRASRGRKPRIVASEVRRSDTDRKVAKLGTDIVKRMSEMFGSHPSSLRKMFLRAPRTRDGSASVADVTKALRDAGVLAANEESVGILLGAHNNTADRVTYDSFASAIADATLNETTRGIEAAPVSSSDDAAVVPANSLLSAANATHTATQMASTAMLEALTDPVAAPFRLVTAAGQSNNEGLKNTRVPPNPDQVLAADALSRVHAQLSLNAYTPTTFFLKTDKQRDGFVTHTEIKQALQNLGAGLTADDADRIVQVMDKDNTGIIDHAHFVQTLFPPDTHPKSKAYPFERDSSKVVIRKVRQELPKWAHAPSYDMMRTQTDADAVPYTEGADSARLQPLQTTFDAEPEVHGPSWLNIPTVDEHGLYQTERDVVVEGVTTKSRRHFNLDRPAPYLYGNLQPRDTYGMPAPHLVPTKLKQAAADAKQTAGGRRSSIVDLNSGVAAQLEQAMWGASRFEGAETGASLETIQKGKRSNAILRRVMDKLESKTKDPRKVWAKLNNNHDNSCDVREMREGLAKLGVHLSADEFKLFLSRIDVDSSRNITFDEFARAFKGDDPLPEELYVHNTDRPADDSDPVWFQLGYRRHRYDFNDDARGVANQGAPRNQASDSRAAWLSIQDSGGGHAAPASSLEEARMQLEVVDRMESKSRNLREIYCKLASAGGTEKLPAEPAELRKRFASVGVVLSERQTEAFLRPVLSSVSSFAAPVPEVDYRTFVELVQPRAFLAPASTDTPMGSLRSPLPVGRMTRSVSETLTKPLMGLSSGEGVGHFGLPPNPSEEVKAAVMPISLANYVRKSNTSTTGIDWDTLALASSKIQSHGNVSDELHTTDSPHREPMKQAAEEQWKDLPAAGVVPIREVGLKRVNQQHSKARDKDEVRDLIHRPSETAEQPTVFADAPAKIGEPKKRNEALAEDSPNAFLSSSKAANRWMDRPSAPPSRARAASADPGRRSAARFQVDDDAVVTSAGVIDARRPRVRVNHEMVPAGVASPRQPQVIAAASRIMGEDAPTSKKANVEKVIVDRNASSEALTAPSYPTGDPQLLEDMRNKVKRGLYAPDRAQRAIADTLPSTLPASPRASESLPHERTYFNESVSSTPRSAQRFDVADYSKPQSRSMFREAAAPRLDFDNTPRSASVGRVPYSPYGPAPTPKTVGSSPYVGLQSSTTGPISPSGTVPMSPAGVSTARQPRTIAAATSLASGLETRSERKHYPGLERKHFESQIYFA